MHKTMRGAFVYSFDWCWLLVVLPPLKPLRFGYFAPDMSDLLS